MGLSTHREAGKQADTQAGAAASSYTSLCKAHCVWYLQGNGQETDVEDVGREQFKWSADLVFL